MSDLERKLINYDEESLNKFICVMEQMRITGNGLSI